MTTILFSDIKRKCSKTDCKNLEKEVGEFDRLNTNYQLLFMSYLILLVYGSNKT